MFQPWRLKLREAEAALRADRLDEASRMLCQGELREFLPAKRLLGQVAGRMVQRGRERAARGETAAGWGDLDKALALGADPQAVGALRRELLDRAISEIESYLDAANAELALARLEELKRRHAMTAEARLLDGVARKLIAAERYVRRGKFAKAEVELADALALRPDLTALAERRKACSLKAAESRRLAAELHEHLAGERWTQVLATAEALLAISPEDGPARDARRRAWAAVGTELVDSAAPAGRRKIEVASAVGVKGASPMHIAENNHDQAASGLRFLLWVDAVGGFLVCQGREVTLGQPVPGRHVDVPILGDLSGLHAKIRRDGEGYLVEAIRPTRVDGREVDGVALLDDGAVISMGGGVEVRFRRPHPLSSTARLEIISRHRTQPPVDAVLLLGESCVLGPKQSSHVVCRDWSQEVVIHRQQDELTCCFSGSLEVDGRSYEGRAPLTHSSRVSGDDFSLTLEPL